jgi:hypothetical protein
MSLLIQDLPDKLAGLVEQFTNMNKHLQYSHQASGQCVIITHKFYRFLEDAGYSRKELDKIGEVASWWWAGSCPNEGGRICFDIGPETPHRLYYNNGHPGHLCAWISEGVVSNNGFFIDFTARQYSKDASFPLIWCGLGLAIYSSYQSDFIN